MHMGVCSKGTRGPKLNSSLHSRRHAFPRANSNANNQALVDAAVEGSAGKCPALRSLPKPMGRWQSLISQLKDSRAHTMKVIQGNASGIGTDFTFGVLPTLHVGGGAAVKEVMSYEADGDLVVGYPPTIVRMLGSDAVNMQTDAARHRSLRRIIMPALGLDAVEGYTRDIAAFAEDLLARWAKTCEQDVTTVKPFEDLRAFTFHVITHVVLDWRVSEGEKKDMLHHFYTLTSNLFTPFPWDAWPFPFHAAMRSREALVQHVEAQVAAARAAMVLEAAGRASSPGPSSHGQQASSIPSPQASDRAASPSTAQATSLSSPSQERNAAMSPLRRLLTEVDESGQKLSDKAISDNMIALLFAGSDTTATTLLGLLNDLAQHPEVMAQLRREQRDVVREFGPDMSPEAVRAMRYTEAVMRETLRLRSTVPGVLRTNPVPITVQGHEVPPKQFISVNTWDMALQDPRWPHGTGGSLDGAVYNPARFLTEEGGKPGAQAPFGLGVHTCAGQALATAELKVFLAVLARGYVFSADTNTAWDGLPLPLPRNGLPIFVRRI